MSASALFYAAMKAWRESEVIDAETAVELMTLVQDVRAEAMQDGKAMAGHNFRFTKEEDCRLIALEQAVKASKSAEDVLTYATRYANWLQAGEQPSSDKEDTSRDCGALLDTPERTCALEIGHSHISAQYQHVTRDGILFNV